MKILVSCIPFDDGKSGISVYIRNVVSALKSAGHDLTLIVEPAAVNEFADYKLIKTPKMMKHAVFSMFYHLVILPFRIKRRDFDFALIAAGNRRTWGFYPVCTFAVIHDLSQYHVKNKYDFFRMFYCKKVLPFFIRRADKIIAISNSTAQDLIDFWHVAPEKITVNYNGLTIAEGVEGAGFLTKFNLMPKRYLLYISRIEYPGKNQLNLIKAYEKLPPELKQNYKLVLAGSLWPGAEPVLDYIKNSPDADSIVLTSFVSTDLLPEAYRNAALYVFPSFFEGFGLSLIEAMYYEVPCCCSNSSSLGEIGKGAALLFDPENVDEISRCLGEILTDKNQICAKLLAAGKKRCRDFNWDKHAEKIIEVFDCEHTEVLNVRFFNGTMAGALEKIDAATKILGKHFFAFVNADCINKAYKDLKYCNLLSRADEVFADGVGMEIAAKHAKKPVKDNVNGTDMFPLLCQTGHRIFLLGGRPGVAEQAAENMRKSYSATNIVGTQHGFFTDEKNVIEKINAAHPEILLVAFGVPKQEFWIAEHQTELNVPVSIGVGGLFDFYSGRIKRAPLWLRKMKLEWTYRLYNEPVRLFRRYIIGNPLFLFRVYFK